MRYGRKTDETKGIRIRILVVGLIFSALYLVVGARVIYLQAFCADMLAGEASREYQKVRVTTGKRGAIYDRNNMEMAVTIDTVSIGMHPGVMINAEDKVNDLAAALGVKAGEIRKQIASGKSFVWLKRNVMPAEADAVRRIGLDRGAIAFVPERQRVYPNKTLAAQVIGFSGIDEKGLEGLEYTYDASLRGLKVERTIIKDAIGRDLYTEDGDAGGSSGNSLVLTIDGTIQSIVETVLEETARTYEAASGMAVVMDPRTGEVLAMANYPFFNPNAFSRYDRRWWRNRTVTDAFEPGSTMKIFLAAAALEAGVCTPDSVFFCEEGKYRVYKNLVHDTKAHGWLSLGQIVQFSSNIGAVKISEMIGRQVLWESLHRFGFGQETGINCSGETQGRLADYARWTPIDTGAIAFGQGISVSAIQLVTALSAVANDGVLMKPHVVKAVVDENGSVVRQYGVTQGRRIISRETARTVTDIMETVTAVDGTGKMAAIKGYTVCGKTGTAQKYNAEGGYAEDEFLASFMGFVPKVDPRIAVLVVLDAPQKHHYGGVVAAPAFRRIAYEVLSYLGVPPEFEKDRGKMMVSIPGEVNG
ncbi:peptidoglycan D,D-transpeptidase FtsI family protein [Desulfosudis oleivorans]|uniref:Peptidoglycan glycosyltransferase n=1 Tax=Desulfosudis oleivorans (strain DSM 6200 / JCM 39069 / Hxd3) TaxID=96561 RepID=A8ZXW9_DESOH|nr:penicillin-binding protein 2 [Desulfosudis oleivorans]ABW68596.1 Peptidoglycan glycosyltransferase [Desulfosudis oleivorans Hxd3]